MNKLQKYIEKIKTSIKYKFNCLFLYKLLETSFTSFTPKIPNP